MLNEFFKQKEKPQSLKAFTEKCENRIATGDNGRYKVMIEDGVEVVGLGDYGADVNAISSEMLQGVLKRGRNIRAINLDALLS